MPERAVPATEAPSLPWQPETVRASVDTARPAIDRQGKTGHHGRGVRDEFLLSQTFLGSHVGLQQAQVEAEFDQTWTHQP